MTSANNPRNAYTDAPEQHPNLIVGSLQLLFWLFFRPTAWRNYTDRVAPALHANLPRRRHLNWKNFALWKVLIQLYLILPLIISLFLGLMLKIGGNSFGEIAFYVALSLAFLMAFIMVSARSFIGAFILAFGVGIGLIWVDSVPINLLFILEVGVAFGIVGSIASARGSSLAIVLTIARTITVQSALVFLATVYVSRLPDILLSIVNIFVIAFISIVFFLIPLLFLIGGSLLLITGKNESAKKCFMNSFIGIIEGALLIITIQLSRNIYFNIINSIYSEVSILKIVRIAAFLAGFSIREWRAIIFYPLQLVWNNIIYGIDQRKINITTTSLLSYNAAFWDEWQPLHLYGLDKHIILVSKHNPDEGKAAINYLINTHQRWATQAAQIELDARSLERCENVETIRNAYRSLGVKELASPASASLRSFSRISENVDAALNQESAYNQHLALNSVAEHLERLLEETIRSSDKYAVRFHPIATRWHHIITDYLSELTKEVELRQEIDNPYIIGTPLNKDQKIFVKPTDISGTDISKRIEQLLVDRRRPPLLLYGQRRMGKTSLLNNLGNLLPSTIIPLFVDLQGSISKGSDPAGFFFGLARGMKKSAKDQRGLTLPPLTREDLATDPFSCFDEWLDKVEKALEQNTALLALDEFEALDTAISKGRFDEQDVLEMLRNLIQHRPRFKVLLAGSHTIEEFQRWASYLINVQVVHISYLKEAEARKLIEQPIEDFTLRYEPDAVQRVLDLTRCHPYLVQLLCSEIVVLKNEQNPAARRLATLTDVEAAVPEALSKGQFFFADIERNQVDEAGLLLLRFIADRGEGGIASREALSRHFSDTLDSTLNLLLQRELIEPISDGYRFQVELIRRWFA